MTTIKNPIIPGFNPDPSCVCVNGTFYLITSSFLYFPGIPVYTSKNLKDWTQIGNVINRPEQYDYSQGRIRPGTQYSGGIWAPTIRYHDGTFYVITTFVYTEKDWDDYSRWVNVIFTSKDPHTNQWGDPIYFDYPGYDVSLFWDDDGKAYMTGSFYWRIRYELSQYEIDLKTGKSLSGEPRALWSGMGGIGPEAPHIYKRHGKYYLMIAEGGTEFGHCATLAVAPTIWGPFIPCPSNPILTTTSKNSLIQTVGHADIFEDTRSAEQKRGDDASPFGESQFWIVALASRVVNDSRPIGRETVLMKVDWSGEYPVIDTSTIDLPIEHLTKAPALDGPLLDVLTEPRHHLLHLRVPEPNTIQFKGDGKAYIVPKPGHRYLLTEPLGSQLFLGVRQRHLHFECQVELELRATNGKQSLPKDTAVGFAVYLDHERHYAAEATPDGAVRFIAVQPQGQENSVSEAPAPNLAGITGRSPLEKQPIPSSTTALLRVLGTPETFTFQQAPRGIAEATGEGIWEPVGNGPGSGVSGGFTGTILAIYAIPGEGEDAADFEVEIKGWKYRAMAEE